MLENCFFVGVKKIDQAVAKAVVKHSGDIPVRNFGPLCCHCSVPSNWQVWVRFLFLGTGAPAITKNSRNAQSTFVGIAIFSRPWLRGGLSAQHFKLLAIISA
jgi:hypothetical protein